MKFLVVLIILLASGCTIKDCKVDPTLEITQTDSKNTGTDKYISMDTVQDLARDATKGGQVTCRF